MKAIDFTPGPSPGNRFNQAKHALTPLEQGELPPPEPKRRVAQAERGGIPDPLHDEAWDPTC